jgi:hypothetical protein
MELDFYREGQVNNNLHGSFRSSMINFLQTDIVGTPTYSMNPNILSQLQQFLLKFSDSELDKQQKISMWDQHLENKTTKKLFGINYQKLQLQPLVFNFQFLQR